MKFTRTRHIALIVFILLLSGNVFSQLTFQSILGLNSTDEAEGIFQKPDSDFVVSGYISNNLGVSNLATASIKQNGGVINSTIFQTSFPTNFYEAKKTLKTLDNNYLVLGGYETGLKTGRDIVLLKLDGANAKVWLKKLVGPNEEYGIDIIEDRTDGGFVIAGSDSVILTGRKEAIVIKTDKDGIFKWGAKLPFIEDASVTGIIQVTSNDDFIITGFFARKLIPAGVSPTIFVATISNVDGSLKALNYYSRGNISSKNISSKIIYTPNAPDNGFLVVGAQSELPALNHDILVLKFKDDATLTWANSYGSAGSKDEMAFSAVSINADNDFIISGFSDDAIGNGGKDGFLLNVNATSAAINWQHLYGAANDEQFNNLIQTKDNGFIAVGKSNSAAFGVLATDFYIVKTDALGSTNCNVKGANFIVADETGKLTKTVYAGATIPYPLATNMVALSPTNVALVNKIICSPLITEAGSDKKICAGIIKITGDSASGGKKPYSYKWTNANGFMPLAQSTLLNPTTNAITVATKFFLKVTDANLVSSIDSFKVSVLLSSNFSGLPDSSCSSGSMAKLSTAVSVTIQGSGISYNGSFWYFDPQAAGVGSHIIRSFGCDTTIKTVFVKSAPCISNIVKDTASGSIVDPQGLFTDCNGIIYLTNKYDIVTIDTFGVVKNIIGNKTTGGYIDGPKNVVRLLFPFGIVKLPDGTVYFADNSNFAVRMMRPDSSVVTIAGSPPPGLPVSAFLDGIGTAARFVSPYGLTYDKIHNCLYVSDDDPLGTGEGKIRMIDLTNNKVTTLVGGGLISPITTTPVKGTTVMLSRPRHISTDGIYIYIVNQVGDPGTAKNILRYTLSDSMIVRYAGVSGGGLPDGPKIQRLSAHFTQPVGICNTCSGDLFISDEGLSVIRIVHNDTVSYYQDNSLFFKPQGISAYIKGFIDVANKGNNNVLRVTIKDWQLSPWIGLDTADFTYCLGAPADTLHPIYKCGTYTGTGISMVGSKYIFTPPTVIGNYTISFTYDVGLCTETLSKIIKIVKSTKLTMPDSAAICSGNNALLDAGSGFVKYKWNTGQTTQTINATTTGSYSVTIIDKFGCKPSDTTYVTARLKPIIDAGTDKIICTGASAKIGGNPTAAGAAPFNYLWSPAITINDTAIANPIVNPLSTTKYTLKASDKFGCIAKDSVVITVKPLPVADVGGSPFYTCVGKPFKIGAPPVNGMIYSWTPGAQLDNPASSNPWVNASVNTFFVLTVIDNASGCSAKDSTLVFVYSNPVIDAGLNDSICLGSSMMLNGKIISSAATITSTIWTPTTSIDFPTTLTPNASPAVTENYKLTVIDGNACKSVDSVWIYVSDIIADGGKDTYVCIGKGITIGGTPTASGGFGSIGYSWVPNIALNSTIVSNPIANPVVDTKYKITLTDNKGCKATDSIVVSVFNKPIVNAGLTDTVCKRDFATLGGSPTASSGHKPYTYSWSPGSLMLDSTLANPTAKTIVLTTYIVTATDSAGCSDTASIKIDVFLLPIADAGPDDTICHGLSKTIGGSPTGSGTIGPYTFVWSDSSSLINNKIANPIASPENTKLYKVVVIDAINCKSSDSMTLTVLPIAGINKKDTSICNHDSVHLVAQGGTNYQWNPTKWLDNPTIFNPIAYPDSTINYQVIISSKFCASDTETVKIKILPVPIISAGPDTVIFRGDEIRLYANGGVSYQWTPVNWISGQDTMQHPIVRPLDSVLFVVVGKNIFGCSAYDSVKIKINGKINVFVPSAFTPGLKGSNNDILKVETVGISKIHFWIYNRWGELTFETLDKEIGWDGYYKGLLQHSQTLGYILETEDFDGNKKIFKGTITLLQ